MKQLLISWAVICSFNFVQAQSTTNYYDRMNQIFGLIDKTKVTTGFLKEFGIRFNCIESYNGIMSDTNHVDLTQWKSLYNSLYSMRVGTIASSMAVPATVFSNLTSQQSANPEVVLLAVQYYTYQQYKTNAYSSGDVTVTNERIRDVTGRNPYEVKTAFAVAPVKYSLKGNTFVFKLQSSMIYSNTNQTLNVVEIDFGNGQGYQAVSLNSEKTVSYSSGGEKELRVKFVYSSGSTLYSHAKLYINYVPSIAQARFNGSGANTFTVSGDTYLGVSATADVTIETAGTDGILDKPLIVIEGFDPDGSFDYQDFISRDDPGSIEVEINMPGLPILTLNQAIEDEGYDLVFINYRNGTDYIQRNAYMVEAVIQWVNDNKVGNEKNVVLGMSMGGLVARYALRHMEMTGRTHETKLYISHDAPHQGANVPVAYQAFVRHLAGESLSWPVFLSLFKIEIVDLTDLLPALGDGLGLLNSPAAQQMLIYQLSGTGTSVSSATNSLFTSFATEYRNMGYPVQDGIRNIAISNGSECGTPLDFAPYASLVNINEKIDLPFFVTNLVLTIANAASFNPGRAITSFLSTNTDIKVKFAMHALPNQLSQQVYSGRVYIKKKVLGFINVEESIINEETLSSTTSMLPLDNTGGGVYSLSQFVDLPPAISKFILQQRFNFVPTFSSLDIGGGTQTITYNDIAKTYSPVAPPLAPKRTPFHNFFTNPTTSENHTQFTLNNGNWLLAEIDDDAATTAFYSCASSCSTPPAALTVTGSSPVCTGGEVFTLNNLAPEAAVTWQASPTNLFMTSSGSGTSGVVRAQSHTSGQGTITFNISTGCGGSFPITKSFWVGSPAFPSELKGPTQLTPGLQAQYFTTPASGGTSYSWDIPTGCYNNYCWELISSYASSKSVSGSVRAGNPGYTALQVKATNSCGVDSRSIYVNVQNPYGGGGGGGGGGGDCGPTVTASPNPIRDDGFTVNVIYPPDPCDPTVTRLSSISAEEESTYVIMDDQGRVWSSGKFSGQSVKIRPEKMKRGIYILQVTHQKKILKERIVVE